MLEIVQFITFFCILLFAIWAVIRIIYGYKDTVYFIIIVFFITFAVPMAFDVFRGFPEYQGQPGFQLANEDMLTTIIYCAYILVIPPIWIITGRHNKPQIKYPLLSEAKKIKKNRLFGMQQILYLMLIGPLIAIVLAPDSTIYMKYAVPLQEGYTYNVQVNAYQNIMSLLSLLSIIAASGLLLLRDKLNLIYFMIILPWILLSIWVNGKRGIIVFVLILLFYVFWQKNILRGWILPTVTIVAMIVVGLFLTNYQNERVDRSVFTSSDKEYDNFRVDYGRDNKTKMTIFSELHPDQMKILEYRGQSVLFYLTVYVPRSMWPEKPWPYAIYFTSAMLMIPPEALGWGMTTSWLEEAIANFSWFGMLIGPLLISFICRMGDKLGAQLPLIKPLTVLIASLFLVVQLTVFFPILLLWVSIIIWNKLRTRKVAVYE